MYLSTEMAVNIYKLVKPSIYTVNPWNTHPDHPHNHLCAKFEAAGNGAPTVHMRKSHINKLMINMLVGERSCLLVKKTYRADPFARVPNTIAIVKYTPSDVRIKGDSNSAGVFVSLFVIFV